MTILIKAVGDIMVAYKTEFIQGVELKTACSDDTSIQRSNYSVTCSTSNASEISCLSIMQFLC